MPLAIQGTRRGLSVSHGGWVVGVRRQIRLSALFEVKEWMGLTKTEMLCIAHLNDYSSTNPSFFFLIYTKYFNTVRIFSVDTDHILPRGTRPQEPPALLVGKHRRPGPSRITAEFVTSSEILKRPSELSQGSR